jgi:hypothetical protein
MATMSQSYELTTIFRQPGPRQVSAMLHDLHSTREALKDCSPLLDNWYLKGKARDEAYLYHAFETSGPTPAATAVLTESLKNVIDPRIISIWNGHEGTEGASLQYVSRIAPETSMVVLRAKPAAFSETTEQAVKLVQKIVGVFSSNMASLASTDYADQKVFKDRLGVGWMLYLPLVFTTQQIPEARALIPVFSKNEIGKNNQAGTIVVSVTDELFSTSNPEHVSIANAIEIRLADQDLLPRFADL